MTEQQQRIYFYAQQGYPYSEVARLVGCNPSLAYDQVRFIENKGYNVRRTPANRRHVKVRLRDIPSWSVDK